MANIVLEILHIQAAMCDKPHDSRNRALELNAWITGAFPILAILMRFASRYLGGNNYWWDDWVHLASVVSNSTVTSTHHTYYQLRSCRFPRLLHCS